MKRVLVSLLSAAVLAVALVGPATAAGKPPANPTLTANCAVGGMTAYTWSHLKVLAIEVFWMTPDNITYLGDTGAIPTAHPNKPNGSGSVATASNVAAGDVAYVDFIYDANGDAWQQSATCN
jgi:hypothetical protein